MKIKRHGFKYDMFGRCPFGETGERLVTRGQASYVIGLGTHCIFPVGPEMEAGAKNREVVSN